MSSPLMQSLTALQKKTPGKFVNETSGPKTMTFILSVRLNVNQTTDLKKKIKVLCEQTRELTHDFLDYV